MGVGEVDRPSGQTLEVGSLDSGMIVEGRDIVVQVINRDEEDVGPARGPERDEHEREDAGEEEAN